MAAWLNLFQLLEGVKTITVVAGLIAVVIGVLNIKDYFWLRRGVTLSLSGNQRSRLFKRMRGLLAADRLPTLVLGTLALAAAANSYELLCTMGLPMVFTRILTLEQLPALLAAGRRFDTIVLDPPAGTPAQARTRRDRRPAATARRRSG